MRRVIFNQKGGVGKTTITCNLAAVSAARGNRTLVIDLDPQGNATQYLLGEESDSLTDTLYDFFHNSLQFSIRRKRTDSFVHRTPFENLDILPSHPELADIQSKLESRYKMFRLRDAMRSLKKYDLIYMDTPPALNFFTLSSLIASDTCLIPFDCDDFSRRALYTLLKSVQDIKDDHNPRLNVEGIIVNHFQSRARFPQKVVNELIDEGMPILNSFLSTSVKIRESHEKARPLIYMDSRHKLTGQFIALFDELH